MPNTTVPAAGGAMPAANLNRRAALSVAALAIANIAGCCASVPAYSETAAPLTPIMTLFREWEANYHAGGNDAPDDVCNAHMDRCREIEARMLALPSTSAADLAAKYIVATGYAGWIDDGALLTEAMELVKGGAL